MQRSLPPLSLSKPPLALVLAQVRMSPVEAMVEYIPAIQDRFRKAGFPEFREVEVHGHLLVGGQTVMQQLAPQWEFLDKANTTSILLNLDAITVQTTDYKRFEDLEGTLHLAFAIIHEVVGLAQVHRYGLRYINVIRLGGDPDFAAWVQPYLLGHPNFPEAQRMGSFSETVFFGDASNRLVARCMTLHSGLPIPADLSPCSLRLPFATPLNEPFVVIDNDHGLVRPEDFDPALAVEAISGLHDMLDLAFRTSVTPQALEKWT